MLGLALKLVQQCPYWRHHFDFYPGLPKVKDPRWQTAITTQRKTQILGFSRYNIICWCHLLLAVSTTMGWRDRTMELVQNHRPLRWIWSTTVSFLLYSVETWRDCDHSTSCLATTFTPEWSAVSVLPRNSIHCG